VKFRYKMTVCIISLITIVFGLGGTILLYMSFQSAVDREKISATKSFSLMINTFSIVSQASKWTTTDAIGEDFKNIADKNDLFTEIILSRADETLYSKNNLFKIQNEIEDELENGKVVYKIIQQNDRFFIILSSLVKVQSVDFKIDAYYEITDLYLQRQEQQRIYRIVFGIVTVAGAFLAYVLSLLLTRPISKLRRIASRISEGNYNLRSKINTHDEIGELSREFNHMADSLVDKMDEINAAMERQNVFIGNFTHELKTPMTSMIGYADLLRRQTLDENEQIDAVNYIYTESKRLERLSIKMLELIVAENNVQELSLQNPSIIIAGIVDHYQLKFNESNIAINYSCENGKCRLEADYFTSLVINLMENARRAMDNGGVIDIKLQMTEDGCVLTVSDNGCGIEEEKLKHLTEAFYRVDKARSRSFGGAGLGLSLCDRIVKLHKGKLEITSTVGVGTTVTAYLKGGRE